MATGWLSRLPAASPASQAVTRHGTARCRLSSTARRRLQPKALPSASPASSGEFDGTILVVNVQPPTVQPPPQPLAIMHSGAFMRHHLSAAIPVTVAAGSEPNWYQPQRNDGNAIMWALEKVDRQLDQIESDPPAILQASYSITSGPVGTATAKGVHAAARVTMAATAQAVKAAAPVGSWAVREGLKAAAGLAAMALDKQQQEQRQREKPQHAKQTPGGTQQLQHPSNRQPAAKQGRAPVVKGKSPAGVKSSR